MNGLRRGGIFAQVLALSLLGVQVPDRHAEAVSRAEEALVGALNYLPEGWDRSEAFRLLRADAGARAAAGPAFADAVADVVELMQRWSNEGWRPVLAHTEAGPGGWTCLVRFAGPGRYRIQLARNGEIDVLSSDWLPTLPEARDAVLVMAKRTILERQLAADAHQHVERLASRPDISPPNKAQGVAVLGVDLGTGDESVRITRDGGREDSFARMQRLAFNTTADRPRAAQASVRKAAASVATLGESFKGAATSIREFKRYSARPPKAPRLKSPELRETRREEKRAAKAKRGRTKARRGFA